MNGESSAVSGDAVSKGRIQSTGPRAVVLYETLLEKDGQGLDRVVHRSSTKRHDLNTRDNVRFDVLGSERLG